jgi:glycosyltransferase involved in cell wall biosynthesis
MTPAFDFYILIPCYNNFAGLRRSLQSVVYPRDKYGVVIVDDGSDEPISASALGNCIPPMTRIIRQPENTGITAALNAGLRWLDGRGDHRFVARLDCGDICTPERFTRQVNYLTLNPEIALLGTWVRFENFATGSSYLYKTPVEQREIQRGMHFRNLFIHPSVMWRASGRSGVNRYPYDLPHAEDYGFFYKIVLQGRAAILPEVLTICEINPEGLSFRNRRQQLVSRIKTVLRYGNNKLLGSVGALKLVLLLLIPYRVILTLKSIIW